MSYQKTILGAAWAACVLTLSACTDDPGPEPQFDLKAANLVTQSPSIENPPKVLADMLFDTDKIENSFDAGAGLTGWVVVNTMNPTRPSIVYTLPDGRHAMTGVLHGYGKQGLENLTAKHFADNTVEFDLDPFWADVEESAWVADGAQGEAVTSTIYGFFDANCVFCHLSWLALKPYMDAGLQVRWIPVATLEQSSGAKAAALLLADNPREVMEKGHANWHVGKENAFPRVGEVSSEMQSRLDSNGLLMSLLGISGTPGFVYKDKEGRVKSQLGTPKLQDIPDMVGMPAIENDDPRLNDFR